MQAGRFFENLTGFSGKAGFLKLNQNDNQDSSIGHYSLELGFVEIIQKSGQ